MDFKFFSKIFTFLIFFVAVFLLGHFSCTEKPQKELVPYEVLEIRTDTVIDTVVKWKEHKNAFEHIRVGGLVKDSVSGLVVSSFPVSDSLISGTIRIVSSIIPDTVSFDYTALIPERVIKTTITDSVFVGINQNQFFISGSASFKPFGEIGVTADYITRKGWLFGYGFSVNGHGNFHSFRIGKRIILRNRGSPN